MSKEFNSILDKLKTISQDKLNTVYIPSLDNTVQFIPFNIKQQKDVLNTISDDNTSPISFSIVMLESILSNLVTKQSLRSRDKNAILLQMREQSISPTVIGTDSDGNKIDIKISDIVKVIKDNNVVLDSGEVTYDAITIKLSSPFIEKEIHINKQIKNFIGNGKDDKVKTLVGEIYLAELIKFIDTITITENGIASDIGFNTCSLHDKISIISIFNSEISKKIISFVTQVRDFEKLGEKYTLDGVEYVIDLETSFLN